jgi:hypothetical protein
MKKVELDLPINTGLMVRVTGYLINVAGLSVVLHKRPTDSKNHNADAWTASEYHTGMELLNPMDKKLRKDVNSRTKVSDIIQKKITEANVQKYLTAVKTNKAKWVNK